MPACSLNLADLIWKRASRGLSQFPYGPFATCFVVSLILAGCETEPIIPAPIKDQSIALPKEKASVKAETLVKPDSAVKPASASGNPPSQAQNGAPATGMQAPEAVKPQEALQDGAVASPLKGDGESVQSVPQHQRVILDERAKALEDQNATVPSNRSVIPYPTQSVLPATPVNWAWPTDLSISLPFSDARKGVDFSGPAGQPVKAVANGIASYLGSSLRGYGQMVVIKHDEGFISVYANNSKILVKEGQKIEKGQKIAETGHADGSDLALHFELRQQGKPLDPKALFPPR
jgi:lipoprotein NlpD